jgi:ABC-type glycerol-3-phosphate transport system permease component
MGTNLSRRGFLELTGLAGLGLAVAGSTAGCSSGPPAGAATWAMWSSSAAEKTTIPLIILFFLTQRWFVRGITMSGLGGR